ncbi:transmembrane and ubiquitin-like domain-containing protein 1 isoform X1 [Schistocerca americana]|uniref:transmembrane and ubiquitin-like domain-containing protein 1 isoform X1 n=1 Tax=Schistocerca americana TaxID=7009 RepID=UPI001F4F1D8D|nr:transmembrane and ubiquitin-like domain-containing protein 1 isoform X1 [Schistocerca americana]
MPLIEGVGDEVIQFFSVLIAVIVAVVAWRSTGISDRPIFRTVRNRTYMVLILERRSRLRQALGELPPPSATVGANSSVESDDTGQTDVTVDAADDGSPAEETTADDTLAVAEAEAGGDTESASVDDKEPDSEGTGSPNTLRRRRLAFFQSRQVTLLEPNATSDVVVEASAPPAEEASSAAEDAGDCIRIRLKYLNDDQKLVDGKLNERLGEFKRRHFASELSADKLVRLIFNGQVLGSDSETLRQLGLFDNCVVHCLVHTPRPGSTGVGSSSQLHSQQSSLRGSLTLGGGDAGVGGAAGTEGGREWDLGNVLFASLSLALGVAWYCRLQYAQLFSVTTTVALVGLTGVVAFTVLGTYIPDQDVVRQ